MKKILIGFSILITGCTQTGSVVEPKVIIVHDTIYVKKYESEVDSLVREIQTYKGLKESEKNRADDYANELYALKHAQ